MNTQTSIRKYISLQFVTEKAVLVSLYDLLHEVDKLSEKQLSRLVSVKVCGALPNGDPRPALVVGDDADTQMEHVKAGEDYIIRGAQDFMKLRVCALKEGAHAVLVLQF